MKENNLHLFVYSGMAVLLAIMIFNTLSVSQLSSDFTAKIILAKQEAKLPAISLTIINSSCRECSDVSDVVAGLKALDVSITAETTLEGNSAEAETLIGQYSIKRLPAVIVEGETSELQLGGFRQQGNVFLFDSAPAPYQDAASKKIIGKVSVIMLEDTSCSICRDFSLSVEGLRQNKVLIAEEKKIDYKSEKGQELISQNSIEKIPALLLSKDLDAYPTISQNLQNTDIDKENFYVIESSAPYIEADSGTLRGNVSIILLDDTACEDCYDVTIHKQILASFGIVPETEETIDVNSSEGEKLIQQYSITKVPTLLLKGDVEAYPQLEEMWLEQLGTKEEDGSYVFRELQMLGQDSKFIELE